ncbi:NADAR family protein [Anaerobiospirillum thomasii]|uniref:Swarming motility protein ybiA n=1 Tax=Anaerobiospirillum thomasii TaxID=179995 RepID=A0A2X0V9Q5_9GAMM|nr:NADAR family protein [Anaerobiospirillum thomasii]SPT70503.1 Swarming motility protein ybiA [Anaerobiospirillum thomasii]
MALQDKKLMAPPWLAYPEIERHSIGWSMGYGENYIYKFGSWLDTLSEDERAQYRALFAEPVTWRGWWDDDDSSLPLVHNNFVIDAWQAEGRPKYDLKWLQNEYGAGRTKDLCLFWGHRPCKDGSIGKGCFSQWWRQSFSAMNYTYLYMEQYMMAAKAELFGDSVIRQQILECDDPKQIKELGRKVRGFDHKVWDKFKYSIVLNGNYLKFSQNRDLRDFLLSTYDKVIVEASPYDATWGICLSGSDPKSYDPMLWRGENLLGFALMEVRDEIHRVTVHEKLCSLKAL